MTQSAYDSSLVYGKGQMVIVNGILYQASQRVPINTSPPNGTYWQIVGGEQAATPASIPAHYAFPFQVGQYTAAQLAAGVPITTYIPNEGDVVIEAWFEVEVAFNGTTPKLDWGSFSSTEGIMHELNSAVVDGTAADGAVANNDTFKTPSAKLGGVALRVVKTAPLYVVCSEDGTKGGTTTGATSGTAILHLIVIPASEFTPQNN